MLKLSFFKGEGETGPTAIPLFGPADRAFEKTAAPSLLPDVARYISNLTPRPDAQYVLVNAMGATEYYGSNVNGDSFPEASLIHRPDRWTGNPLIDRIVGKSWTYGYPTFYNAHVFAHHRNKDAAQAFGDVELTAWNPHMKRVELVLRVDRDKCQRFGGTGVWDKLKAGSYPDVSMGTRVPYDTCSVCLDRDLYARAIRTFDPKKHAHPGIAALEFHKKLLQQNGHGIRGLSITRKDYCEHARTAMNRILPDGRKVWVDNDYPKFFDISFVFIGADKTAKTMLFISSGGQRYQMKSSAEMAEDVGLKELAEKTAEPMVKSASISDELLKNAFLGKKGTIDKNTIPSQFGGKAIPVLAGQEAQMPADLLDGMSRLPLPSVMSTMGSLGMVLQPREFQRLMLLQIGKRELADQLDASGQVFGGSEESEPTSLSPDGFMPALARLLAGRTDERSGFGPILERRIIMISTRPVEPEHAPGALKLSSSVSTDLLCKIGAAYNGYRAALMNLFPYSQSLLKTAGHPVLTKLSELPLAEILTPLSIQYFKTAHLGRFGVLDGGVLQH